MKVFLLLALLLLSLPGPAHADTLTLFDGNSSVVMSIDLPSAPEIMDFSDGEYFTAYGTSDEVGAVYVGFGSADYAAQLFLAGSFGFEYFSGSALYANGEQTPTLIAGSYNLTSFEGLPYTLDIDGGTAVTPEPASLLLCETGGLLPLCFFLYRRHLSV